MVDTASKYLIGIDLNLSDVNVSQNINEDENKSEDIFFVIDNTPSVGKKDKPILKKEEKNELSMEKSKVKSCSPSGIELISSLRKFNKCNGKKLDKKSKRRLKTIPDRSNEPEIMKESVLQANYEKNYAIPPYVESIRKIKQERKKEREKTKGPNWYHMPAPEMTDEIKNDLQALQMRKSWDPKLFYKKNDLKVLPKYFQVGTIIETKADFYHSRVPKKQRKRTIVDELLADATFKQYNKRKLNEIISKQPLRRRIANKKKKQNK